MRRPRVPAAASAALVVCSLVAAACGSSPAENAAPASDGDPSVSDVDAPEGPGSLIAAHPLGADQVPGGAVGWEVVYASTGAGGERREVSGTVFAPDRPLAAGEERPVVSWAYPSRGTADHCAPEVDRPDIPLLDDLLAAGYVVAATRYAGQSAEGVYAPLLADDVAPGVLDVVRAAQEVAGAGAGGRVVVAGHLQGGYAALAAVAAAPEIAPDLAVRGVVASAAPMDVLAAMVSAASDRTRFGRFAQVLYGYDAAYDDLDAADLLTPDAVAELGIIDRACSADVVAHFDGLGEDLGRLLARSPLDHPLWAERFRTNGVAGATLGVPLLVLQDEDDELYPVTATDGNIASLCEAGNTVEYRVVPAGGADHHALYEVERDAALTWVRDRFDEVPATSTC
jgi:hypothetical protein